MYILRIYKLNYYDVNILNFRMYIFNMSMCKIFSILEKNLVCL